MPLPTEKEKQTAEDVKALIAATDWVVPPKSHKMNDVRRAQRIQRVVEEMVTCGSMKEAAVRAGYGARHARRWMAKLRREHPEVMIEVMKRREVLRQKVELNQESVLIGLAQLAFSNIGRAASWEDGKLVIADSEMIDPDTMAAIQEVTVDKDGALKIKLYDKKGALVDLGKFLGMAQPADVAALLARVSGNPDDVIEGARLDPREAARRVALMLRKGQQLTVTKTASRTTAAVGTVT